MREVLHKDAIMGMIILHGSMMHLMMQLKSVLFGGERGIFAPNVAKRENGSVPILMQCIILHISTIEGQCLQLFIPERILPTCQIAKVINLALVHRRLQEARLQCTTGVGVYHSVLLHHPILRQKYLYLIL